jgi:hypothetical protein
MPPIERLCAHCFNGGTVALLSHTFNVSTFGFPFKMYLDLMIKRMIDADGLEIFADIKNALRL